MSIQSVSFGNYSGWGVSMVEKRSKADGFMLRFPDGMRDRLKAAADANGRSMNSEIVLRLQSVLDRRDDGTIAVWFPPELLARIYDEANRTETDPNLLILDTVEAAFPRRPQLHDRLREIADELAATKRSETPEARSVLDAVEKLLTSKNWPA